MGVLKDKSGFNLDSAELLYNNSLYAPSVHCSYYAFLQRLKYNLKIYTGKTYEIIEQECLKSRFGTHGYLINEFRTILRHKDHREYKTAKRAIDDLKNFREDSDYFDVIIGPDESDKALKLSKYLISEINDKVKK